MTQFAKYRAVHILAFLLFLAAMTGPWMFDRVYVPAKYACDYRLEGDFCGVPMSGFQVLSWVGLGIIGFFVQLFTPNSNRARMIEYLIVLFFIFPVFPFLSNLLMILKQKSQRLQITNLICWGLASLLVLPLLISGLDAQANHLWGLWLYVGLAMSMTCVEVMFIKRTTSTH